MPKVKGPLFSLEASGTYADALTFHQSATGPQVRKKPTPTGPQTLAQQLHRAKVSDMAATWRAQTTATRNAWAAAALLVGKTGRAYWWQQWFIQNATAGSPPAIP